MTIKEWIEEKKANGALSGIVFAPIGWLLLGLILSSVFYSCEVRADYLFPEGPVITIYAEVPKNTPFCVGGGKEINSNVSISQSIWKSGGISLAAQYTHHSCAFLKDENPYDAVGFGLIWRIGQ